MASKNDSARRALMQVLAHFGGRIPTSKALKTTNQCLTGWINRGHVSAGRVLEIERRTGIPRHALRPDIYPRPKRAPKAQPLDVAA